MKRFPLPFPSSLMILMRQNYKFVDEKVMISLITLLIALSIGLGVVLFLWRERPQVRFSSVFPH